MTIKRDNFCNRKATLYLIIKYPSTSTMASSNVLSSSSQDLLDAQAHVISQILNYINSMALKCALQLGIPDIIHKHGKPITLSELAHALPINKANSDGLRRLMRILVHSKLFDKVKTSHSDDDEDVYSLTRASHFLLRDGPFSNAQLVLSFTSPIVMDPFHLMSEWFQDESPSPFFTRHGMGVWEFAGKDEKFNHQFNEAMGNDARFVGGILAKECKQVFEGLKSMVDVAGGTGAVAKAVVDSFPGLECTVLDLPHVVAGLGGSENLKFVSGDMFEFIPHADAVFLKWIMHDWSDENCVKILGKCKEAIIGSKNNGGKVIIVDMVVDIEKQEHEATETQLLCDIILMTVFTGKERTEKEWAKLFAAAGFKNYKISPILGLRSVIEVFP